MKVAILGKFFKSEPSDYITKLISLLKKRKVSVFLEKEYYIQLKELLTENINSFTELDKSYDLLISIGGDGTILKAITFVKHLSIPIVGINSSCSKCLKMRNFTLFIATFILV
jgi:NAD+ kinase